MQRKTIEDFLHSFDVDDVEYLGTLKKSLLAVLVSLQEEHEEIKSHYSQEVAKLNSIINEKQQQIRKLKQSSMTKAEPYPKQSLNATPYKILLKESTRKQDRNEEIYESPCLNKLQNRLSLQVGQCGLESHRRHKRSAYSKLNSKQDYLHEVNLVKQNNEIVGNVSSRNSTQHLIHLNNTENLKLSKCNTSRNYKQQPVKCEENFEKRNGEMENKSSSLQVRSKLCRKPSNKNKRGLLERKKQATPFDAGKLRSIDIKIPIKLINFSTLKPR